MAPAKMREACRYLSGMSVALIPVSAAWVMLDVDELLQACAAERALALALRLEHFPSEAAAHYVSFRFRLSKREFNALELHLLL
jgi:hypothetical protein